MLLHHSNINNHYFHPDFISSQDRMVTLQTQLDVFPTWIINILLLTDVQVGIRLHHFLFRRTYEFA